MIKGLESLQVYNLIIEGVACYDEILVKILFSLAYAIAILSITLSSRQVQDNVIWHHTKTYVYSCKFTYHVAIDINRPYI